MKKTLLASCLILAFAVQYVYAGDTRLEENMQASKITKDVSYDVGVLTHYYSSNNLQPSVNTTEIYDRTDDGSAQSDYSGMLTNAFLSGAPEVTDTGTPPARITAFM